MMKTLMNQNEREILCSIREGLADLESEADALEAVQSLEELVDAAGDFEEHIQRVRSMAYDLRVSFSHRKHTQV